MAGLAGVVALVVVTLPGTPDGDGNRGNEDAG